MTSKVLREIYDDNLKSTIRLKMLDNGNVVMLVTAVLLCLALALSCWLFASYARKSGDNLPSVPDVVTQLKNQGDEAATDTLRGYSLETLKSVWGEPEWELFGMFGCIWGSDGEEFIVYFDDHARVEQVKQNERNP